MNLSVRKRETRLAAVLCLPLLSPLFGFTTAAAATLARPPLLVRSLSSSLPNGAPSFLVSTESGRRRSDGRTNQSSDPPGHPTGFEGRLRGSMVDAQRKVAFLSSSPLHTLTLSPTHRECYVHDDRSLHSRRFSSSPQLR